MILERTGQLHEGRNGGISCSLMGPHTQNTPDMQQMFISYLWLTVWLIFKEATSVIDF